jgi:hypothetical protein
VPFGLRIAPGCYSGFRSDVSSPGFQLALSVAAKAAESKRGGPAFDFPFGSASTPLGGTLRLNGVWSWTHTNANRSKANDFGALGARFGYAVEFAPFTGEETRVKRVRVKAVFKINTSRNPLRV